MLKKMVVTNYRGESVTYKITEGENISDKNKLPVTLENLKQWNTDGVWNDNWFVSSNSGGDINYMVNTDNDGLVTSIDVSGVIHRFSIWDNDEEFILTNGLSGINSHDTVSMILSGCNSGGHDTYWMSAKARGSADETFQYNEEVSFDFAPTDVYDFKFRINRDMAEEAGEDIDLNTTIYPMARLSSDPSGFEPYNPHGGEELEDTSELLITSVEGLGPVKANINMAEIPTFDGSIFNSARLTSRNLVIRALYTDDNNSIEEARHKTYNFFPIKSKVNIKIVTDTREMETEGYVESNEPDIFSEQSGCQISILCPSAYFSGNNIVANLPKTITYNGEADNGAEFVFEIPKSNIIESCKATNLTIIKDGTEFMSFDFSKISNLVPNTSPNNTSTQKCSFVMDDEHWKFLKIIPDSAFGVSPNTIGSIYPVVYKGELHCFIATIDGATNPTLGHIRWNPDTYEWVIVEVSNILNSDPVEPSWVINLNDTLYLYQFGNGIYRYSDDSFSWRKLDLSIPFEYDNIESDHLATVYGGKIHCFTTEYVNHSYYVTRHHTFDGSTIELVEDQSLNNVVFDSNGERMVLWGNAACISDKIDTADETMYMFVDKLDTNNFRHLHIYRFNGSAWVSVADILEHSVAAEWSDFVVYKNKIHAFEGNNHYTYDLNQGSWDEAYTPPVAIGGPQVYEYTTSRSVIVHDGYMYMVGSKHPSLLNDIPTYSEDPNNTSLIENDVVIINTNSGQKSVYLYRHNKGFNILNTLMPGFSWIGIKKGNQFITYTYTGEDCDESLLVVAKELYEGV